MADFETLITGYPNLKFYAKFMSGGLTTDSSGHSHDLTAISDPTAISFKYGRGVEYDSNDAFSVVNHADFRPAGSYSIGCWFNTSTNQSGPHLIQSFNYASGVESGWGLILGTDGGAQFFHAFNTGTAINTDLKFALDTRGPSAQNLVDGEDHFLVGTYDGTTMKLYIDGGLAGTKVSGAPVYGSGNRVRVGCISSDIGGDEGFLQGKQGEVFIINGTALSAEQVAELYNTDEPGEGGGEGDDCDCCAEVETVKESVFTRLQVLRDEIEAIEDELGELCSDE